jgi:hypothetical protein
MQEANARAYLAGDRTCPYCETDQPPQRLKPYELEGDTIIVRCCCTNPECSARWLELYDFAAIANAQDFDPESETYSIPAALCRCQKEGPSAWVKRAREAEELLSKIGRHGDDAKHSMEWEDELFGLCEQAKKIGARSDDEFTRKIRHYGDPPAGPGKDVVISVHGGCADLVSRPDGFTGRVLMRDYDVEDCSLPESELGVDQDGDRYREVELT